MLLTKYTFASILVDVSEARNARSLPRYYVGRLDFEQREYAVVNVDDLAADLRRIAQWIGCQPPPARLPHTRANYSARNDTYLSPRGRANLAAFLKREYEVYACINARAAVNARNVTVPGHGLANCSVSPFSR